MTGSDDGDDRGGSQDVSAAGGSDGGSGGDGRNGGPEAGGTDGPGDEPAGEGSSDAGATSIKLFGIHSVARVVGFLGLIYFARVLPQSELGVYFLFYLVVQITSMVSQVGMSSAIVQRISGTDRPDQMYSAALSVIAGVAITVGVVLLLPPVRSALAGYIGVDVPGLLLLGIAGWLFADVHLNTLQGEDRVLVSGLVQLLQDVVRVGVGAALLTAGFGEIGLMYGVIAGFGATTLAGVVLTDLHLRVPRRADFGTLFAISKYTAFFGPTNLIYFWFDTFMIGLLLTKVAVSSYEVAWQTTRVLLIPTAAIVQTVYPKISRWASEDEYDEIERILPGSILFTLTIPLPGMVGLAVLGPDILGLVYKPAYTDAALAMALLAGYMVLESLHRLGQIVSTGLDRADIPFRTRLVGVTLAVVLNVALIPPYGLLGAAVATVVAKAVDAIAMWYGLASLLSIELPLRSLFWQAGSALAMGLVIFGGSTLVPVGSLPILAGFVLLGVGVYGGLILLDPDIRYVIDQYVPVTIFRGEL